MKIDSHNVELHSFKVCAFFETQCRKTCVADALFLGCS